MHNCVFVMYLAEGQLISNKIYSAG